MSPTSQVVRLSANDFRCRNTLYFRFQPWQGVAFLVMLPFHIIQHQHVQHCPQPHSLEHLKFGNVSHNFLVAQLGAHQQSTVIPWHAALASGSVQLTTTCCWLSAGLLFPSPLDYSPTLTTRVFSGLSIYAALFPGRELAKFGLPEATFCQPLSPCLPACAKSISEKVGRCACYSRAQGAWNKIVLGLAPSESLITDARRVGVNCWSPPDTQGTRRCSVFKVNPCDMCLLPCVLFATHAVEGLLQGWACRNETCACKHITEAGWLKWSA